MYQVKSSPISRSVALESCLHGRACPMNFKVSCQSSTPDNQQEDCLLRVPETCVSVIPENFIPVNFRPVSSFRPIVKYQTTITLSSSSFNLYCYFSLSCVCAKSVFWMSWHWWVCHNCCRGCIHSLLDFVVQDNESQAPARTSSWWKVCGHHFFNPEQSKLACLIAFSDWCGTAILQIFGALKFRQRAITGCSVLFQCRCARMLPWSLNVFFSFRSLFNFGKTIDHRKFWK